MWARIGTRRRPDASAATVSNGDRLEALRQYGNFALAYSAAFQSGMEYFGNAEGFLAYKQIGATAFVLSNPVAPLERCEALIRRFAQEKNDICFWQASPVVGNSTPLLSRIGMPSFNLK